MKNSVILIIICLLPLFISCEKKLKQNEYTGNEIKELQTNMAQGWNTWNTRSMLSHVLLPEKIAFDIHLKEGKSGDTLKEALIGRRGGNVENVVVGKRSYDGSYIEFNVTWRDLELEVKSAVVNDDVYLLANPVKASSTDSIIVVPHMIWDGKGTISIENNTAKMQTATKTINLYVLGDKVTSTANEIKLAINTPLILSTTKEKQFKAIEAILADAKNNLEKERFKYKDVTNAYEAVQSGLAWNIIYEPTHERVIMPVSRVWNVQWKGWVLFDWDTYFGAYMLSMDAKEVAYSNAIVMTKEITDRGFIPNFKAATTYSEDRSQPPVGSFVVNQIYKKYKEKWFLNEVFEELLSWNRWWATNRDVDGYLCWGSDPYDTSETPEWLKKHVAKKVAGMWESGLDNSPMYDNAIFDETIDKLMLADVGLMSMYIWDCHNLAEIAKELNKPEIEQEILKRAEKYSAKLKTLWDEDFGLYLNKDLVTGKLSYRLSPTNFYPLLSKVPTQKQAKRMINSHFYNPEEFWGTYMLPSIARNDPAYNDMVYWRGRIWGPMNFLVYLGLRNYDLPNVRKDLVRKSEELLLQSWNSEKHIYENYNAETGQGDDVESSDKFYHWCALLGFIKNYGRRETLKTKQNRKKYPINACDFNFKMKYKLRSYYI